MKSKESKLSSGSHYSLKREMTSGYNHKMFNRANTTYYDIEKAHYEAT